MLGELKCDGWCNRLSIDLATLVEIERKLKVRDLPIVEIEKESLKEGTGSMVLVRPRMPRKVGGREARPTPDLVLT